MESGIGLKRLVLPRKSLLNFKNLFDRIEQSEKTKTETTKNIMKNTPNKTRILGLVLALGALPIVATVTGCAGDRYHQSTGEAIDDRAVSSRVKSALSDNNEYKFDGVQVTTFKGTVQLSGFVDTSAQKSQAGDIAKNVQDVKDVVNNITVKE